LRSSAFLLSWKFSSFWVRPLVPDLFDNDPKGIIPNDPKWIKRNFNLITIEQLRAARGLLGWSQSELGERAGLSLPTVKRLEGGYGPRVSDEARAKLQRAIEAAGIDLIDENGGGLGVRFRKARRRK
jgi:DNA-binding XRE family transcriptional regulator